MSHVKLPTFKVLIVLSVELEKSCQRVLVVLQLMSIEHSVANVVFYFNEPLRSETKQEDYNYTITACRLLST